MTTIPQSFKPARPSTRIPSAVSVRTIRTLAERIFRKNLAAQYADPDHGFLQDEDKLIQDSVEDLRLQIRQVTSVHLTIAGIHVFIVQEAEEASELPDYSDVDEVKMKAALSGVERDSMEILSKLCEPL